MDNNCRRRNPYKFGYLLLLVSRFTIPRHFGPFFALSDSNFYSDDLLRADYKSVEYAAGTVKETFKNCVMFLPIKIRASWRRIKCTFIGKDIKRIDVENKEESPFWRKKGSLSWICNAWGDNTFWLSQTEGISVDIELLERNVSSLLGGKEWIYRKLHSMQFVLLLAAKLPLFLYLILSGDFGFSATVKREYWLQYLSRPNEMAPKDGVGWFSCKSINILSRLFETLFIIII